MTKKFTIKSWGYRLHFVRKDSGEQPFYAPAFFVMKYLLILLLLAGCTKEYSRECSGCIMITEMYVGDVRISTTRQTQDCYSGKGDSTYYRGDTMFIRKMKCK